MSFRNISSTVLTSPKYDVLMQLKSMCILETIHTKWSSYIFHNSDCLNFGKFYFATSAFFWRWFWHLCVVRERERNWTKWKMCVGKTEAEKAKSGKCQLPYFHYRSPRATRGCNYWGCLGRERKFIVEATKRWWQCCHYWVHYSESR